MKKIICLCLVVVNMFLLCLTGCGRIENTEEKANPASDFEYEENENGGISITKYIGEANEVIIPKSIDGKAVTKIEDFAFNIAPVDLSYVKIPETVVEIGNNAFAECTKLTMVDLSEGLKIIGGGAFRQCFKLYEIELPNSLTEIGTYAFKRCSSLNYIKIPKGVTEWGYDTFSESGIEKVEFEDGLEIIGKDAFAVTNVKKVEIPKSVKEISDGAFGACTDLESVTLNEGLITIGDNAFAGQSQLKEIVIPKSVENIIDRAFSGCNTLEKVKFEGDAPETYVRENSIITVVDVYYTICYHKEAKGFTSPEWYGYKTEIW